MKSPRPKGPRALTKHQYWASDDDTFARRRVRRDVRDRPRTANIQLSVNPQQQQDDRKQLQKQMVDDAYLVLVERGGNCATFTGGRFGVK